MSRLVREGTAEFFSRDQILRRERRQWKIISSVQLTTTRIGNLTRLIHLLLDVMTIILHQYYCSGCGKREVHKKWFMAKTEKTATVQSITMRTTNCAGGLSVNAVGM